MSSRLAADVYPSLSNGIGMDGGYDLRHVDTSLDRTVIAGRSSHEKPEPDSHAVTYNVGHHSCKYLTVLEAFLIVSGISSLPSQTRFQFFHSKRTSIINDSPANDVSRKLQDRHLYMIT